MFIKAFEIFLQSLAYSFWPFIFITIILVLLFLANYMENENENDKR